MKIAGLLIALLAISFSAQVVAQGVPAKSRQQVQYQKAQERIAALNFELAPIKGSADLAIYLNENRNKSTPLDRLSKLGKKQFLESIVFTARGVGSFDAGPLRDELTPTETHAILSLFGLQHKTHVVKNRRIASKADNMLLSPQFCWLDPSDEDYGLCDGGGGPIGTDYPGYKCDGKANCERSYDQTICIGDNCGKK